MRKVVFQMMTTLNGRLGDPDAWMDAGVSDDLFKEIDRFYESFDALLVGDVTAREMAVDWPAMGADPQAPETVKSMAQKMNSYKKYVITKETDAAPIDWTNVERVHIADEKALVDFVQQLKAGEGKDIHLAGGATLARTLIGLDLVDEYHFYIYPVVSAGATWFDAIKDKRTLKLMETKHFENGVVGLYYKSNA